MKVLITGGAGYIGSHTCLNLLREGYDVAVVDNLCNASEESLKRVQQITGRSLLFYKLDLLDKSGLTSIFRSQEIDAVVHLAGLKAVGESTEMPLCYYQNNITGTLILLEVMKDFGVKTIVFSSSATVYGNPQKVPITEDFPLYPTNPYGRTKLMIEEILRDVRASDSGWQIVLLRYFNPVGAHESGQIGEDPNGVPNNLFPYMAQVAVGKLKELSVFGRDYPTPDGTGVRDYIHVVDLARGHLKALEKLGTKPGLVTFNLGTGRGYSVLEAIEAFSKASGRPIPHKIVARRPGDVASCYADPSLARRELGWKSTRDLAMMCADAWRWQAYNPSGFGILKRAAGNNV
jgi:UDP-glucose 4-epimerase